MFTRDSFPLTHLFLCYQILENTKNYLYTIFFIKTNKALHLRYLMVYLPFKFEKKKKIAHLASERAMVLQYIRTQELVNFEK